MFLQMLSLEMPKQATDAQGCKLLGANKLAQATIAQRCKLLL